ncbi:hypothetical protein EGR_10555 [Echinococcus granulosus]|uniref:Uncharacterized protein n=1 Tax=Echinococcus granulosus TaxID=6210 RepID=W6U234_ECHGR|nr:hypothetical protein EGR_10555 [Echinococcus granulosus]EUB54586.1 hypothetical protein EGR_10555 [Echinococcus granulosus]
MDVYTGSVNCGSFVATQATIYCFGFDICYVHIRSYFQLPGVAVQHIEANIILTTRNKIYGKQIWVHLGAICFISWNTLKCSQDYNKALQVVWLVQFLNAFWLTTMKMSNKLCKLLRNSFDNIAGMVNIVNLKHNYYAFNCSFSVQYLSVESNLHMTCSSFLKNVNKVCFYKKLISIMNVRKKHQRAIEKELTVGAMRQSTSVYTKRNKKLTTYLGIFVSKFEPIRRSNKLKRHINAKNCNISARINMRAPQKKPKQKENKLAYEGIPKHSRRGKSTVTKKEQNSVILLLEFVLPVVVAL